MQLYCESHPFLKLGPGTLPPEEVITFVNGFAEIADDDPNYAEKLRWTTAIGTPLIEQLGENTEGRVTTGAPEAFVCAIDGKSFGTQQGFRGHMLGHAKAAKAAKG
jgi:hypothetical protein